MSKLSRREALKFLAAGPVACSSKVAKKDFDASESKKTGYLAAKEHTLANPIRSIKSLPQGPWPTEDPFLFCVHHNDQYPKGNARFGPDSSLKGRQIGTDFSGKDGWSMYHGDVVPGFPRHPHRGFETVTVVRDGLVDHADSLGAAARYGRGDVQWLTTGSGINHAEMFPLLDDSQPNPIDFFQIWLNLPRAKKMVDPYFSMFWANDVPIVNIEDKSGNKSEIRIVAGTLKQHKAPSPPPDSWASSPESDVAIWSMRLQPRSLLELPAVKVGTHRNLYVLSGAFKIGSQVVSAGHVASLATADAVVLENDGQLTDVLLLQGRPIAEPIARYGPFVMNTREEIQQAFSDYRRTQFGGWPWDADDPVHGNEDARFAKHADGRIEKPV